MLELLLTIAVIGLVVWLLITYVPMPDAFRKVIIGVGVVAVVVMALHAFGVAVPLVGIVL